jgi:hypothetical protein
LAAFALFFGVAAASEGWRVISTSFFCAAHGVLRPLAMSFSQQRFHPGNSLRQKWNAAYERKIGPSDTESIAQEHPPKWVGQAKKSPQWARARLGVIH